MTEDDKELLAYIHFFRRTNPENKDKVIELCKFLHKQGIKVQLSNVKTHLYKIQEDLKQTSIEIDGNYEGGFNEEMIGIRCQLALYGPFDRSIN